MNFRKSVEVIANSDSNIHDLSSKLKISLSDLEFADFFINNTQRWRMLPPVLGGLAVQENTAALYGSRTPHLAKKLKNAAETHGCRFEIEKLQNCPTLIRVIGEKKNIAAIANQIEVSFEHNNARKAVRKVPSILHMLETATEEPRPLNWKVRSFDFKTNAWVDDVLLPNAACEFIPTYGQSKFFVYKKHGRLLRMPKWESLYSAAMLKGIQLIEYDFNALKLSTPSFAPMPELYARAACLCSGRPAEILNRRIVYSDVTPEIAALLMVSAGQPYPRFLYPD